MSDIEEEDIDIWPDCWDSFLVFKDMSTQWRTGACGVTGLDYNALDIVLRSYDLLDSLGDIFPDIRVMESEAMVIMREQMKKNDSNNR